MRHLHVKNGLVTNIVEYPTAPPLVSEDGAVIVPAVTGLESVGSAVNVTDDVNNRHFDTFDLVFAQELLRLTNELRALAKPTPLPPFTAAQYKTYLKTLM